MSVLVPGLRLSVVALACGCVGAVAPAAPEPAPAAPAPVASPCGPAAPRLRRLSLAEYQAAVADPTGESVDAAASFPPDPRVGGLDNDARALSVTADHVDEFGRVAARVAARLDVGAACARGEAPPDCARAFAARFARRAYRRPLDAEEVDRLMALYASAGQHEAGLRLVAEAVLQWPFFLYRPELGEGGRLTAHEAAAALSFFLTGGPPDEALARAADDGTLVHADRLRAEARRLAATPRAQAHLRRFLLLWLGADDVAAIAKDADHFPAFNPRLRAEMVRELDRFIDHALAGEGGTLEALLLGTTTFVGPGLTALYGDALEGPPDGDGRARLDPARRRGLLSLPGVLARHATVEGTSPVERGLFVKVRLLCGTVPAPPPGVVPLPPRAGDLKAAKLTTRAAFERHTSDPACAPCHRTFDPIGYGLEGIDGMGRARTHEHEQPIDDRGALVGTDVDGPFRGPAELAGRLARSETFRACFARQLFRLAEGRREQDGDRCALDPILDAFARAPGPIADLMVDLAARDGVLARRTEAAP